MIALGLTVAAIAAVLTFSAGWLLAARRGRDVRMGLESELALSEQRRAEGAAIRASLQERVQSLEQDVSIARAETAAARADGVATERLEAQMQTTLQAVARSERELQSQVRQDIKTLGEALVKRDDVSLRTELQRHLQPLVQQVGASAVLRGDLERMLAPLVRQQTDSAGLQATVRALLAPMMERERIVQEMGRIEASSRESLPRVLDAIAATAGFGTVLLSDAVGLPMAANATAADTETHAGIASLLLTLADRVAANRQPAPLAAVLRDEANQVIVHRIFRLGEERFVLTAVAKGVSLPPDILDPALRPIEQILGH